MFRTLTAAALVGLLSIPTLAEDKKLTALSYTLKDIRGKEVELSKFKGKMIVLVNVASECGLTPQYDGLQALYAKYEKKGLVVIGIPSNEFGAQEPGTNEEIEKFCTSKYKVTFPMMAKIVIKGKGMHPLYKYLTSVETAPAKKGDVAWNFEKFIIGKNGNVVARFEPQTEPDDKKFVETIESELKK